MAVSLLSGLAFLAVSITTFKNDKIAYIFETNNSIINNSSEQVKNDIRLATDEVKELLLRINADGSFNQLTNNKLNDTSPIERLEIYKIANDKSIKLFSFLNKNGFDELMPTGLETAARAAGSGKALAYIKEHLLIAENLQMGSESVTILYFLKSKALEKFFETGKSYLSFLIDSKGRIIKADESVDDRYVADNFLKSFQEIKKLSSTTLRIETQDKKNWLMTSVSLGFEDYYMVSMADEDLAMSAIKALTTKSALIFAIIFFIIVIIGVFTSNYLTSRLSLLTTATEKVISGDYKFVLQSKGQDEITELTNNFNQMTFEIVRLIGETAHKARMEAELSTAKLVQETLFPKSEHQFSNLHIKGHYISASECGGDWWHYSENAEVINIWIADATGHGASAALLTSAAKSAVTLIETMNVTPVESMSLLNQAICSVSKENMMMTCFLAVFNKKTKVMKYVNASHEAPIILKPSENIKKNDFIFLNDFSAPRLGQSSDSVYQQSEVQLNTGDRLLFYTDGIPDIQNGKAESLGERGFFKLLSSTYNKKLNFIEFVDSFTLSLVDYRQRSELIDDVTYCFTEIS